MKNILVAALSSLLISVAAFADGESSLAKQTQNPVADLISVPFQNNTNFGLGPEDRTGNNLNIQPVLPFHLGDWNLISRTIMPIDYRPDVFESSGGEFGLGDIDQSFFFSPAEASEWIWGIGPDIILPTAVNDRLGNGKWSIGPSVLALTMQGPWVVGALAKNLWSVAGDSDRNNVNFFLMQPFVNYNLNDGWYLTSSPIITADWNSESSSNRWIVPVGGGFGKVHRVGAQPINLSLQVFGSAERPSGGPDWTLRTQVQLLFPK